MVRALLLALAVFARAEYRALPSVPASAVLLGRAQTAQIPLPVLAQSIQAAGGIAQAVQAMETMGVLKPGEVNAADPGQALAMRHVLQAVWREAGPTAQAPEVDASWSLPAVVVRTPRTTYYLHGTSHGLGGALEGRAARRLEKQIAASGHSFIAEQSVPAAYRLKTPVEVVDRPQDRVAPAVTRWLSLLTPLGRRFHRFYFRLLAKAAARQGNADLAGHLKAVADRVYSKPVDPAAVLPLDLPLPLKEEVEPGIVARSRALAAAAQEAGADVVHVLSGWSHVPDLASLLGPKKGA